MSRISLTPLVDALHALYPGHLPKRVARRLVTEFVGIVDQCVDQGGDPTTLQLTSRGGRKVSVLAATLKQLRRDANLSREQVAADVGCSSMTIMRIENGNTVTITKPFLLYVLDLYGVTDEAEVDRLVAELG